MSTQEFQSIIINLLKIGGIVFAVIHFFMGLLLFRQMVSMRTVIKSSAGLGLALIGLIHVVLLSIVIALIIFIPAN